MSDFETKTDYLIETKGLLKDRINSLGGSITSGTTFRDYLVWLDSLYEALDEKTITGLPDSLEGKCEQNGTPTPSSPQPIETTTGRQVVSVCGKNFLPNNQTTQTINGITFTMNSDKSVSISGTATAPTDYYFVGGASQYIDLGLPSGNYNLNGVEGGSLATYMLYCVQNRNGSLYYYQSVENTGKIINIQNGDTFRFFIRVLKDAVVNTTIKPMLESGTTATTYEEYKGNDYEINLGKNLANIENIQIGKSWSNVANTNRATILFIPVEKNQQYSLVSSYTNQSITQIRGVLNKGPNDQVSSLVVNGTFKNDSNWTYMSIEVIANTTFTSSMLDGVKIMLCKGTATIDDYAPYKTPIYLGEMRNTNNVVIAKDYIFRNTTENPLYDSNLEEGQWYIHKEIGRVVLNGSENWSGNGQTTDFGQYVHTITDKAYGTTNMLCNTFNVKNTNAENSIAGRTTNSNIYITIEKSIVAYNTNTFKTWLSSHNVELYYVLNTPTNTLIEDEELINQLNEIEIFTVISEDFYN